MVLAADVRKPYTTHFRCQVPVDELGPGEVGYLIAGIKDVGEARSGETVTDASKPASTPLEGYKEPQPMVFCGRSEEHTSELQSLRHLVCRLLLEKKKSYT